MALKLSTGLRNSLLANAFNVGTTMTYNDNGGSPDTITDTENSWLTRGFAVGQSITTANSTTGGNDISGIAITAITASTLSVATGTLAATEAFEADTTITSNNTGSLQELLANGILRIYSGAQPSDPDAAETGTLLVEMTSLNLGPVVSGTVSKLASETWSGTAAASGTAGWFRFLSNDDVTGASSTAVRFDGSVGVSGTTLTLSSTSIVSGATVTVDNFSLTMPAS